MLAVAQSLANKPEGGVLICLIVAIVLFVVAGVLAVVEKAFWVALVAAGLAFVVLAFLVH